VTQLAVRRPAVDDLGVVLALAQAADVAVWGDSDLTEPDLRDEWAELDFDRNAWLVEVDGRVAGYASFENRGAGRLAADGYVHPELTGRGVGAELLRLTEERAREELATIPEGRVYLQSATLKGDDAAERLFLAHGYRPVRHFFRMLIDLDGPPPEPEWPEGIAGERFDPADARAVHATIEEAFANEWGHTYEPFEEWERRRLQGERADPTLWFVARDGDELAAAVVSNWKRNGDWGWIGAVAVRPGWRRRGLGMALLRASFGEFWRRGERRVALGVDAHNPTGATRLYERAGMRVLWQADVYEKELREA
jgi:GNAT superfamily N-acetyltransferase